MRKDRQLLLLLFLLALTPVVWFWGRKGVLIDGSDTNFPLDPVVWLSRRLFVWNSFPNAGMVFASSIAGLIFHLLQVVPYLLGLELQIVQIVNLVFWFTAILFSAYIFARVVLTKRPAAQLIFAALYGFNSYLFNTWENVKVANLALVVALPLVLVIYFSLVERRLNYSRGILFTAVVGLVASGSGINPAYFLCLPLGLVISALTFSLVEGRKKLVSIWLGLGVVCLTLFMVNSFWIFPTLKYLFFSGKSITRISDIGFTNWLESLSEHTSLDNILRLQGAWDWYAVDDSGAPLYIPYAVNYFRSVPFVLFSFILPALVFVSLVFRSSNRRKIYSLFAVFVVLAAFLGAGTHAPTGVLYKVLVSRFPLFSFFRSPWYIFTPFLILAMAGLISLLFDRISRLLSPIWVWLITAVIVSGNLIYSYPLLTGKIFRPGRQDGFYIRFPEYVFEAKNWLRDIPWPGRIIGYPDDEIERFDWGYNAVESILGLFYPGEVIFSPFEEPASNLTLLIRGFYDYLKKGEVHLAFNIAGKLGVGSLFHKADQSSLAPSIEKYLADFESKEIGPWSFYRLPSADRIPKIFFANRMTKVDLLKHPEITMSFLDSRNIAVASKDSLVGSASDLGKDSGWGIWAKNLQKQAMLDFAYSAAETFNRLTPRDLSTASFEFGVERSGNYQIFLERYHLEDFGVAVDKNLAVEIDGSRTILQVERINDSYIVFRPVYFTSGDHKLSFPLETRELIENGDFKEEKIVTRGDLEVKLIQDEKGNKYLEIYNYHPEKSTVDFVPKNFDPFAAYLVEVKFRQLFGDNPQISLEQSNQKTLIKAQIEGMPSLPEWRIFSFYFLPVKTPSTLTLRLMAPAKVNSLGTKVYFDDLSMRRVFTNEMILVSEEKESFLDVPILDYRKISPVRYDGQVEGSQGPQIIVFSENYSPDWEMKIYGGDGSPLLSKPLHFSANLYANAWYLDGVPRLYRFSIYYRPQKIFYLGGALTVLTLFGAIAFDVYIRVRRKKGIYGI